MKSDSEIQRDVQAELHWDPQIDETDVVVAVDSGVVSLDGFVKHYTEKEEAEVAAKRVAGVAGVANDIEVRVPNLDQKPDPDIARASLAAIRSRLPFAAEHVRVIVKNGWVTLEGQVEWQYQKLAAEDGVRALAGVRGLTNHIEISPQVRPSEVKKKIEQAFRRHAEIDAARVMVEAHDDEVILKGSVRNWQERTEAERIAWAAPGVRKVDDRLTIGL
ncbi:MAG TPA: BON domain-containing protein [Steroidobacteraceae bacterium]|nr:BON domain-containing protein [Steroidobacteraceae bacterium]